MFLMRQIHCRPRTHLYEGDLGVLIKLLEKNGWTYCGRWYPAGHTFRKLKSLFVTCQDTCDRSTSTFAKLTVVRRCRKCVVNSKNAHSAVITSVSEDSGSVLAMSKAKIPLGSSRHVSTRHIRRVESMHFGCVELVEQQGSTRSTR